MNLMIILEVTNLRLFKGEHVLEMFKGWPLAMLAASLTVGVFTTGIIEALKRWQRKKNFEKWVKGWLEKGSVLDVIPSDNSMEGTTVENPLSSAPEKPKPSFDLKSVLAQLALLTTGGNEKALYHLPIENLCGQLAIAAQAAMEYPETYKALLGAFISHQVDQKSLNEDWKTVVEFNRTLNSLKTESNNNYNEARNKINNYIQRNIDGLQIDISTKWLNFLWLSCLSCSVILAAVLGFFAFGWADWLTWLVVTIIVGYEGAFLSIVIRGILKRLEKSNV
ncbi:hypothetical protein [Mucilaginibacter agri]|uniref:Uncharacterized protein n=1 Tax=Mucilaginibacter agri TaxID=2695265 RepID=A0A966DVR5_9SPHI|nr:hypothetical protein [Mucilaginibacter agri]NCD71722.1 hypothetical protein [Mucilaginibacter agri]